MTSYFEAIRDKLATGRAGQVLTNALKGELRANSSNRQIWGTLVRSLKFSGIDFEHLYRILPSQSADEEGEAWRYNFEESILLGHTLLIAPVMQHYGPLSPKLDLSHGPTKKFEQAQPLLAVGMVGDCVKGKFFDDIKMMAEKGSEVAIRQRDTLLHPQRLQHKMRGLVRALLHVCREVGRSLLLDATLVGAGAFGGSAKVLAQPFVDSLN